MNAQPDLEATCLCTTCSQKIKFPIGRAGQTVTCPACGMETLLYVPPAEVRTDPPKASEPLTPRLFSDAFYCNACGTVAKPKTKTRGSTWLELIAWLLFLLPGMIYTAYRLSSWHRVCRACESEDLIPVTSPRASAKLLEQFGRQPELAGKTPRTRPEKIDLTLRICVWSAAFFVFVILPLIGHILLRHM